jgi:NADH-quinone oxidoreductase subunit E
MPEITTQAPPAANGVMERHRERIEALAAQYPTRQSLLLPLLWIIQEEDGWISSECMTEAAAICECTPAQVMEVASFYQMYNRAPVGRYVLGVCGTLPCALCGSDGLYDYLKQSLGIGWNQTTPDGMFTIQRRECLGACSEAPVMLLNQELEIKLTRAKVDEILAQCRRGERKPYYTGRTADKTAPKA